MSKIQTKKFTMYDKYEKQFRFPYQKRNDLILSNCLRLFYIPIELRQIIQQYYGKYGYIESEVYQYLSARLLDNDLNWFEENYLQVPKLKNPSIFTKFLFNYENIGLLTNESYENDDFVDDNNYCGDILVELNPNFIKEFMLKIKN
jgi:hypothetical protein